MSVGMAGLEPRPWVGFNAMTRCASTTSVSPIRVDRIPLVRARRVSATVCSPVERLRFTRVRRWDAAGASGGRPIPEGAPGERMQHLVQHDARVAVTIHVRKTYDPVIWRGMARLTDIAIGHELAGGTCG